MDVLLAGMNIDYELLKNYSNLLRNATIHLDDVNDQSKEAKKQLLQTILSQLATNNLTPETLSAAYARISRDPRPVHQLREEACRLVGKARRSNKKIIFGMGHSSVAEHAVFNLDVIGVSRFLSELIQSHRLCSFTEKSQRYIKLDQDFLVPSEINNSSLAKDFRSFMNRRFEDYLSLHQLMLQELGHNEAFCGEDARYVLPLAVTTQMGMTINARNLEKIISQAAASEHIEFQEFGKKLFSVIDGIAPSLIKYTQADNKLNHQNSALNRLFPKQVDDKCKADNNKSPKVKLIRATEDGDKLIGKAVLAAHSGLPSDDPEITQFVNDESRLKDLYLEIFRYMNSWDSAPRAFEYADVTFELVISAAAYAQLKRHRMSTIVTGDYDHFLGIKVPPVLINTEGEEIMLRAARESQELAGKIQEVSSSAIHYARLSCHQRRVIIQLNVRELIHLSRLREDEHAQWDIREICSKLLEKARQKLPLSLTPACGKHEFDDYKSKLLKQ